MALQIGFYSVGEKDIWRICGLEIGNGWTAESLLGGFFSEKV